MKIISRHIKDKKIIKSYYHGFTNRKPHSTSLILLQWNDQLGRHRDSSGSCLPGLQWGYHLRHFCLYSVWNFCFHLYLSALILLPSIIVRSLTPPPWWRRDAAPLALEAACKYSWSNFFYQAETAQLHETLLTQQVLQLPSIIMVLL